MNATTLIQFATLISVAAGVISVSISVRAYKRQVSAHFLLEYTKRGDEIMRSLPPDVWVAHLFPNRGLSEPNDELRVGMLRCLGFIAQFHYFSRKGYIPKSVWRRNQYMYTQTLRSPLFVREWNTLAPMFVMDRAFCRYVERAQHMSEGDAVPTPRLMRHPREPNDHCSTPD